MLAQKEDAIHGRTNHMSFENPTLSVNVTPNEEGVNCNPAGTSCTYVDAIRCFELCGVGHATMWGNLTVVDAPTWTAFIGGT